MTFHFWKRLTVCDFLWNKYRGSKHVTFDSDCISFINCVINAQLHLKSDRYSLSLIINNIFTLPKFSYGLNCSVCEIVCMCFCALVCVCVCVCVCVRVCVYHL
jgi:hypothetical protein